MDTTNFLARVIGPGNYAAINWKKPDQHGMAGRFYPRDKINDAAGMLQWASGQGADAYFALASFRDAEDTGPDKIGRPKFKGSRVAENAEQFKSFWIDIDVKRAGDGKTKDIYGDRVEALTWLKGFLGATNLPPPNLAVDSGYGFHFYWILEDPMPRADWQPYADALAQALRTHQFKCEAGISSDAARILRPPGTMNCKGGAKVPVKVLDKFSRGDYPNQIILDKLQPYVGVGKTTTVVALSGLAGGGPAAAFAGTQTPNMNAAAQAGVTPRAERKFELIATKCEQVKQSLAAQGAGDQYQLWYLGFLSLAHHCVDGDQYVEEISKGDPRFSRANLDKHLAQLKAEKARKDTGPPRCAFFDTERPGVCQGCPHFNKIVSPWSLGVEHGDLPTGYRRQDGKIQRLHQTAESAAWRDLVEGDVYGPVLDETKEGYAINFLYDYAGKQWAVRLVEADMPADAGGLTSLLTRQKIAIEDTNAIEFKRFIMAWIRNIRSNKLVRTESIHPWGYAIDEQGKRTGLAVGGTLYRPDGTTEPAPGGDREMVDAFVPKGNSAKWRAAFDAVCTNRLDLQTLVACSFASPLMHFTGQSGVVVSAWSSSSGAGKSSALEVGQAIWSAHTLVQKTNPTELALNQMLGELSIMPMNWDEMQVGKDSMQIVRALMDVSQGSSRRRLSQSAQLRAIKEWHCIVCVAANAPLMDHVAKSSGATEAVAMRAFEFEIKKPQMDDAARVGRIVSELRYNYGHTGQVYAQWIAQNMAEVEARIVKASDTFTKYLGVKSEERLYVAGMSAIIVAARIANDLGLAAFDKKGMFQFLCDTFNALRATRQTTLVSNGNALDVEELLSQFHSAFIDQKLVTKVFAKSGPRPKGAATNMVQGPLSQRKVEIHVARDDGWMRINRNTFSDWCRRNHYSPTVVINELVKTVGAVLDTKVIGGGTAFAGGQMKVMDIPLDKPGMDAYIPTVEVDDTAVKAAPAPKNKPKA